MATRAPILGICGLVLLIFGLTEHWMTYIAGDGLFSVGWFAAIHLFAGLGCLGSYLLTGGGSWAQFLQQRSTRYGASALLYSAFFVAIMVMINFLGARYNRVFDVSEQGINSLSDQSVQVLNALEEPLEVLAFVGPQDAAFVADIARTYEYASDKVSFKIIDPQTHPEAAQQELISTIPTLKLKMADRATTITHLDEESITSGINKISTSERKVIYFAEGHGEGAISDKETPPGLGQFAEELENQNYSVLPLFVAESVEIPENAAALVISSSDRAWFPSEIDAVDRYLRRGGRLLLLLEPERNPELSGLLEKWGMRAGEDVILEERMRLFEGVSLGLEPVVSHFTEHEAVKPMQGQRAMFSVARTINVRQDAPEGILVEPIAFTSDKSWAESDVSRVFESGEAALQPENDSAGPVPIAIAGIAPLRAIGEPGKGEARLLVFGDTSFLTNQYLHQLFNDALGKASVAWLAGEEQLISIGSRGVRASRAFLTASQARSVFYLSVLVLPELILLLGIAVWWKRSAL
jgi:ABC-type uncharacterized transport system involved in gliding motility auxiliary subunit